MITFDADPSRYRHWRLACEGPIANLTLDVAEEGGLSPGYRLKLNSYDLAVDIELHDALNRIRFEHPEVGVVVITSGKDRVFCTGANIYMVVQASHAEKVNFCKFTNETRNGIEDSSTHSRLKFIAAVNGDLRRRRLRAGARLRRDRHGRRSVEHGQPPAGVKGTDRLANRELVRCHRTSASRFGFREDAQ